MQKCIKLRISKPYGDISWDELGHQFRELSYISCKAMNFVVREQYLRAIAKKNEEPYDEKPYYYPKLSSMHPEVAGHILNALERGAKQKWNQFAKEVLNFRSSLPTFKNRYPVPLHHEGYKILKIEEKYVIDAQLCSKEMERTRFQFEIYGNDGSTKAVLNRILSEEYKKGAAQIVRDHKKNSNKWFFVIPYNFEPNKHDLDENNVMGIDLGISKAAYWAFSGSLKRGFISGDEIEKFRKTVRARRISIQNQGKFCGEGRIGHGKNRRLQPIEVLQTREQNFRNTCNKRYASKIVSEAIRMRCGVIQIEDLSGISDEDTFLKNWPYYDLQMNIVNKAAEEGIKVIKVDPQYTSQRCSECGSINKKNRVDQATFVCQNCGYGSLYHCSECRNMQNQSGSCDKCDSDTKLIKINADYNAARNLAVLDIDRIIKEWLKSNKGANLE